MLCAGSLGGEDESVKENQGLLLGDWGCGVSGIDCGGELVGFVNPASVTTLGLVALFGVLVVEMAQMGLGLFPSSA